MDSEEDNNKGKTHTQTRSMYKVHMRNQSWFFFKKSCTCSVLHASLIVLCHKDLV